MSDQAIFKQYIIRTKMLKEMGEIDFWYNQELMAHLEDELCFETIHGLLLLGYDSIRRNMLP